MKLKFSMYEAKCGYVHYIKIYASIHPTNTKHNSAFTVVNRLFQQIKRKGYTVYRDQWFSSSAYKKTALGTVIPDRKALPKQTLLAKLRIGKIIAYYPVQKNISEVMEDNSFLPSVHLW
jgi:hypothetical protein